MGLFGNWIKPYFKAIETVVKLRIHSCVCHEASDTAVNLAGHNPSYFLESLFLVMLIWQIYAFIEVEHAGKRVKLFMGYAF